MTTLYLGKSLESAIAFAFNQGDEEVIEEFDLTTKIIEEYSRPPEDVAPNSNARFMEKVRAVNVGFKAHYEENGLPVTVGVSTAQRKPYTSYNSPKYLPEIAFYLYDTVWEELVTGWKLVRQRHDDLKDESPTIEINIRSTHSNLGKTSIAAIIIDALVDHGVAGEIHSRDGDIGKFFQDGLESDYSECRLRDDLVKDAIATMKEKGARVVINDTNSPSITRSSGHFTGSKAMNQGGFKRDEMACLAVTDKKDSPEAGTFRIFFPSK